METLKEMIKTGNVKETAGYVKTLLERRENPDAIMKQAMIPAMDEVGALFQEGQYYLPEMLVAAKAMKDGMEILKPILVESGVEPVGKALIGTVKGDLHDIGKNLVVMSLQGAGFEVIDLGTNVSPENFVKAIREHNPEVVGLSALLTTTMLAMEEIIKTIKKEGLREKVKIMIGGAPIRPEFADKIGADFFGKDSTAGKDYARLVVTGEA